MSVAVSVVVLTYNRHESLREMLLQLRTDLASVEFECIVVDNSTQNDTAIMIAAQFPELRYIKNERNVGIAARNIGVRSSSGEVVVTLDDDIQGLSAYSLDLIRRRFEDDPRLGALNFQVVQHYSGKICNWVHHRPIADAADQFITYEITEGAVAFRRDVFIRAGSYYEGFFISHEGPDLAYRIMNLGFNVEYDGRISVRHKHEKRGREDWRFYYYDTRNQFYLAARNMPFFYSLKYLFFGLSSMAVYALRDRQFRAWLRGVGDGLVNFRTVLKTRNSWTPETRRIVKLVDAYRPSTLHMIKVRLLQRENRMEA